MEDDEFCSEMNFNLLPLPPRYHVPGEKKPRHLVMGDFRIPPTPFTAGAQGQIYRVGFKFGDGSLTTPQGDRVKAFAMKKLPKRKLQKEKKELISFKTELNTLFDLYHPNIVRYITHFQDETNVYIVMEFLEGGNLYNRLIKNKKKNSSPFMNVMKEAEDQSEQGSVADLNDLLPVVSQTPRLHQTGYDFGLDGKKPTRKPSEIKVPELDKPFTVKQAIKLGKDILLALQYLHSKNIMHRDIKLENILIDKHGNAKLADFGYLCVLRDHFRFTVCGTDVYMAPEVHSGKYGFEAQIYSCGVLFFEMLTGNIQSNQLPTGGLAQTKPTIKFPQNFENLYPEVCELVYRMLQRNPSERISIEEALEHKAMRRYNKKAPEISGEKKLVDESLVTQLRKELQKRNDQIQILKKIIERQNHQIKTLKKQQPPLFPQLVQNDKQVPQTSEEIDQILIGRKATKKKLKSESGVLSSIDFEEIKQKGGKYGTPGKVDSTSNSLHETAKFRDSETPQYSSDHVYPDNNSHYYHLSFGNQDPASTVESGPDSNSGAGTRKGKQTP